MTAYLCVSYDLQNKQYISLHSINRFVIIIDKEIVYCTVRADSL